MALERGNPASASPVSLDEVQALFGEAIAAEPAITLLRGFKLDLSGNQNFHKVFFSVRCDCGTAALLSVEADRSKSLPQMKEALPGLVGHLKTKALRFLEMSCETHTQLRTRGGFHPPPQ